MSGYPYSLPFLMTETATGAAVCVVLTDGLVKFHDSEAESFPGPVISEYRAATFVDGGATAAFALRLHDEATYLSAETHGVLMAWVEDETKAAQ